MAQQKEIYVTGTVEHLIFYKYRGKYYCRHRPQKVAQTAATRTSGKQFGQAARLSRLLRTSISNLLPDSKDKKMLYRLNNAFYQWLREGGVGAAPATELPHLQDFPFATETLLSTICPQPISVQWDVEGQVSVSIPEIQLKYTISAPSRTHQLQWRITVCSCPLAENVIASEAHHITLDMPYGEGLIPAQELVLPFTLQPGAVAIVAAALRYEYPQREKDLQNGNTRWRPAGIVGSCYRPEEAKGG